MAEFETGSQPGEVVVKLAHKKTREMRDGDLTFTLDLLLENYAIIHGPGTVWDGINGRITTKEALKNAAGNKLVNIWMDHPEKRVVDMNNLVFEPGKNVPGINLFTGLAMEPDPTIARDLYQPILDHLYHLCNQDDELYWWVLRWCAYPLQNLGAKMQTSIIMHGAEGTGKNLWWETILSIYGEYGVIISQSEIESDFNGWASSKMFCIADEVISRAELRHMKGKLKGMITGSKIMINQKGQPQRPETNHMNMVFLSNEDQPIVLDPGDRRYTVIRCDEVKEPAWYQRVGEAIDKGATAGLFSYLMTIDLEGITRHVKPPDSDARKVLIEISKPSAERFIATWLAGDLPVPVQACASVDLYRAYKTWCRQHGERMPATDVRFGRVVGQHVRKTRVKMHLDKIDGDADPKSNKWTLYIPPTDSDEPQSTQANQFRYAVNDWASEVRKSSI